MSPVDHPYIGLERGIDGKRSDHIHRRAALRRGEARQDGVRLKPGMTRQPGVRAANAIPRGDVRIVVDEHRP